MFAGRETDVVARWGSLIPIIRMSEQMQAPLAARWLREAAQAPCCDRQVVEVVDRCRTGSSLNETGLLRDLVAHADAIASGAASMPGADDGGEAA